MIVRMCNGPETGASACLENGHDSSIEQVSRVEPPAHRSVITACMYFSSSDYKGTETSKET